MVKIYIEEITVDEIENINVPTVFFFLGIALRSSHIKTYLFLINGFGIDDR